MTRAPLVLVFSVAALTGCHHGTGGHASDMATSDDDMARGESPDLAGADDMAQGEAGDLAPEDLAQIQSPDLAHGDDMAHGESPDMAMFGPPFSISLNATNKMDILFMVDNSASMEAMQTELRTRFPSFVQPFVDLAQSGVYTDLHFGVVTSDYGAGDAAGGGCSPSPGGDRGRLRALGAAAPAGCVATADAPFIRYKFAPSGDQSNLPGGNTPAALVQQFTCMASVGATGCGFEHQLESVYAALHNSVENAGFLRPDALLAVVLLTNEDDGSAPPTARFYEANADPAVYGAYDTYRQTRFGIQCGGLPIPYADPSGNGLPQLLANCTGEPNPMVDVNAAYDLSRYASFFTQPLANGGVKESPDDVLMVAIDGPTSPFQTVLVQRNSGLGQPPNPAYVPCGPMLDQQCVMRVQHTCQNSVAPGFFGDPAVRIHSVVQAAAHNQTFSICGDDATKAPDYSGALTASANLARARILGNCVPTKIADPQDPDCHVTETVNGIATLLPRCDQGQQPCWTLIDEPSCTGISPDARAIKITRAGPPAAGATVSASCRLP
jgi:hypothetical protein